MDKLTEKIYTDYKNQIDLTGITHSVQLEMKTALLNKVLTELYKSVENLKQNKTVPPHLISLQESKVNAMIAIVTDLTVMTIERFLQEPKSIADGDIE